MEERPAGAAESGRSGEPVSGGSSREAAAPTRSLAHSLGAMEITLSDPSSVAITDSTTSTKDVGAEMTPYHKFIHSLHHDKKILNEVSLGRRVGFYRFRGDLGTGNFSKVKMAVHQLCKERVAIKILDKSKLDHKTLHMLNREIGTMERIHHPNIIRLYEVLVTYSHIHLVLEYASGGELFNKITSSGKFPESEARVLFVQISSAVKYMHENNIIHRDIKAENVFFAAPAVVKLGDFGFSIHLSSGINQQLTTFCGSPPYAAPELFCDESYLGTPVDIWALGVLLYFMITGQMPFKAQTVASLKKHIMDVNYSVPNHVSENCKTIIVGILKHAPKDRLSFEDIEHSDWLKDCPFPLPPKPAEKYSILPTILPVDKNSCSGSVKTDECVIEDDIRVSDIEMKAREQLHNLGITEKLLSEHVERKATSAVIGTYRIVVHRLQRQDTIASEIENETSTTRGISNNSGFSQSAISSGHKFPLYLRRRSKSAAVKSNCPKAQKPRSRTCILL